MVEGQMICARKQLVWVVGSGPTTISFCLLQLAWKYKEALSPHTAQFTAGMSGCSNYSLFREEKWSGEMVRWVP